MYRVPGFLATSFSEDEAEEFLYRATDDVPHVVHLDAPHVVHLDAAIDNNKESMELPLAQHQAMYKALWR